MDNKLPKSAKALVQPLRIALLLYPGCMPAGLFAFADLAHGANRRAGLPLFETAFAALAPGEVGCAHGQSLAAAHALDAGFDAVLLPGFWAESPAHVTQAVAARADVVAALCKLPVRTALWSYCTGVCLLAATGRLRGREATVTWWLADAMRALHPRTEWRTERTYVADGMLACASGVNGYLPIAQDAIARRLSEDGYRDLARLMVLPRPERTHMAFRTLHLIAQNDATVRRLHALAERTAAAELSVPRMAETLHTTARTLARRVAAAAGMPAAAYLRRVKLNQVSERLIATSAPAAAIADELGFSSDAAMSRMFRQLTGMTPAAYRQAFGA